MNASPTEAATERTGDAFRALRRGLSRSEGFAIYVCTCDSRAFRDELIENLAASMTTPVYRLEVGDGGVDLLDAIAEAVSDDGGPVMLVGFERLLEQPMRTASLFDRLNLRREEWPLQLRRPIVFWVPNHLSGHLTGAAPDFFDWRSDTIDFVETGFSAAVFGESRLEYGVNPQFSKAEQEERRRELVSRISATGDSANPQVLTSLATWWNELADIALTRGDADEALRIRREGETLYEKALAINETLGHEASVADNYADLGNVYQIRGELDRAVEMYEKALAINETLGRMTGVASNYGSLGVAYRTRGELDRAVETYEKALAINEALGRKIGMAGNYGDLGNVHQIRGELDRALEMHEKSLAIETALGHKAGMASDYGNLGNVYRTRGELDRAVEMYEKSLALDEALGRKEGMATQYVNLGSVHRTRGELARAVEHWQRALALFDDIGSPNAVVVREWLDGVRPRD